MLSPQTRELTRICSTAYARSRPLDARADRAAQADSAPERAGGSETGAGETGAGQSGAGQSRDARRRQGDLGSRRGGGEREQQAETQRF